MFSNNKKMASEMDALRSMIEHRAENATSREKTGGAPEGGGGGGAVSTPEKAFQQQEQESPTGAADAAMQLEAAVERAIMLRDEQTRRSAAEDHMKTELAITEQRVRKFDETFRENQRIQQEMESFSPSEAWRKTKAPSTQEDKFILVMCSAEKQSPMVELPPSDRLKRSVTQDEAIFGEPLWAGHPMGCPACAGRGAGGVVVEPYDEGVVPD